MIHRRLLTIAVAAAITAIVCLLIDGLSYSIGTVGVAFGLVLFIAVGALRGPPVDERRLLPYLPKSIPGMDISFPVTVESSRKMPRFISPSEWRSPPFICAISAG